MNKKQKILDTLLRTRFIAAESILEMRECSNIFNNHYLDETQQVKAINEVVERLRVSMESKFLDVVEESREYAREKMDPNDVGMIYDKYPELMRQTLDLTDYLKNQRRERVGSKVVASCGCKDNNPDYVEKLEKEVANLKSLNKLYDRDFRLIKKELADTHTHYKVELEHYRNELESKKTTINEMLVQIGKSSVELDYLQRELNRQIKKNGGSGEVS